MDDAQVVEEQFWLIAREIGPLRVAPERPVVSRVLETAVLVVAGPLMVGVMAWSLVSLVLAP